MDDFDFLDEVEMKAGDEDECIHKETIIHRNTIVCVKCGEQLTRCQSQDWNHNEASNYSFRANKKISGGVIETIQPFGFGRDVEEKTYEIYVHISAAREQKFNMRRSILCACVFFALKILGKPLKYTELQKKFHIEKKTALQSRKFVHIHLPREFLTGCEPIDAKSFVTKYMTELHATALEVKQTLTLLDKVRDMEVVNRARPQSIAAGIVYYWIKAEHKQVGITSFSKICGLSEATIQKLIKEFSAGSLYEKGAPAPLQPPGDMDEKGELGPLRRPGDMYS